MNLLMRSGRGASAFNRTDRFQSWPLNDGAASRNAGSHPEERSWGNCFDELLDIRNFENDWDGVGSEAFDPNLVDAASSLAVRFRAEEYPVPDRVIASVNRTIVFEWDTALGFQEIEISSPLDIEKRWVPTGSMKAQVTILSPHRY